MASLGPGVSAEVALRDEELDDLLTKCRTKLDNVAKAKNKGAELEELKAMSDRAGDLVDMLRMEMRTLNNEAAKENYKKRLKAHKDKLKEIKNDLEWQQDAFTRSELLGDRKEPEGPDLNTRDGLMSHARGIMTEDVETLKRTVGVIADTKEIGQQVAVKLEEQRQQIEGIYNDLYEIDDHLKRSMAIMKRMLRRTLTNRYLWCLIMLILIGVVFIGVWKGTGQQGSISRVL